MADGKLDWSEPLAERIEHVLLSISNPCPHALWALECILEARELRAGLRLEGVLCDSLGPFWGNIGIAFVFGSVARKEQVHDSDIDLLLVGEVRLKELSGPLRMAEHILGRRINPVIYTLANFRQKYQAGDPFLTHICRNERIFIKGDDDELRELVAERVSPEA